MCKSLEDMCNQIALEVKRETVLRMLEKGKLLLTEIAEYTGLSLQEVQELQTRTNANTMEHT